MTLERTVSEALARLAPGASRYLVAVSGGGDSVAAVSLLADLDRSLVIGHLDHGLRAESSEDSVFVEGLAAELGIEHVSERVDVSRVAWGRGWNVEDSARRVRYEFLHRTALTRGCDAIVVAHTLDDQAETFLLQALRGSAYPSGMAARRGMVIRPLLGVSGAELRQYLVSRGRSWREDASNLDVGRSRAWLRHAVMPLLAARYPQVAARLARTAAGLGEAKAAIDGVAGALFTGDALRVAALARAPAAIRRAALVALLEREAIAPNAALVDAVAWAVEEASRGSSNGPWRRSVGRGAVVKVAYGRVEVARRAARLLDGPVPVAGEGAWREALRSLPAARREGTPSAETVAGWASVHPGLVLRHRLPGDRVDLPGGHKLLSDLLIDEKVPAEARDGLLVVAADSDVLWAEGVRRDGAVTRDERFMHLALLQAELAAAAGDLPVGAVLVRGDDVIAAGHNRNEATGDPTGHAELEVMRAAGAAEGDWRLAGTTLYVTLEPCPMCFGAVLQTRIDRVVFGAANPRQGAVGGVMDLRVGPWKRPPTVDGGVLEERCARLLSAFFAARR